MLPQSLPYGYLLEAFFAVILVVSLGLAVKYPSFGKRGMLLLFIAGTVELAFAYSGYLVVGMLIGLITVFSGLLVPLFYSIRMYLSRKWAIILILSGFLELIVGSVGLLIRSFPYTQIYVLYVGLLTVGVYSLVIGTARAMKH